VVLAKRPAAAGLVRRRTRIGVLVIEGRREHVIQPAQQVDIGRSQAPEIQVGIHALASGVFGQQSGVEQASTETQDRQLSTFASYVPSSSPTGFRSSTRSQTALTAINSGTPSNSPEIPHNQPQASTPTKIATGFMRLARLVSQGVSR
jgi:hypothetical protein